MIVGAYETGYCNPRLRRVCRTTEGNGFTGVVFWFPWMEDLDLISQPQLMSPSLVVNEAIWFITIALECASTTQILLLLLL